MRRAVDKTRRQGKQHSQLAKTNVNYRQKSRSILYKDLITKSKWQPIKQSEGINSIR